MGVLASEVDSDSITAPSGPYGGKRLLTILLRSGFSSAAYRCVLFVALEFVSAFPYSL